MDSSLRSAARELRGLLLILCALCCVLQASGHAQGAGSIRGVVSDRDFEAPLPDATVLLVESGTEVRSGPQGSYVFGDLEPGVYTLVFSKEGYVRYVKADVVVASGRLTDVDVWLAGDFTDMAEFVVQQLLALGTGTEAALLQLRFDCPALLDSISAALMSRAGAGGAAAALRLVSGATVQDGKFAVIRGLPDRYVNSQMNGIRLPTADEDKRAVQLDQFPSVVIESIQVKKTFTPDQQGDASGGAVNVDLKGIPDELVFQFSAQTSVNSQVAGSDFLTYAGGGVGSFGLDDGGRDVQFSDGLAHDWEGAVGVQRGSAPIDYKLSLGGGGQLIADDELVVGGFASVFYERDSSFYDNGRDDSLWEKAPGEGLTPETKQGVGTVGGDFRTALFDVTKASQSVQWGGLVTLGMELDQDRLGLTYLYTHVADDTVTLAEDTRGKAHFFPGYDPDDLSDPGNDAVNIDSAPWLRSETLAYTERTTQTLQLTGDHVLPTPDFALGSFAFQQPKLDWSLSTSSARLDQPDKRVFGSRWNPAYESASWPPGSTTVTDPTHSEYKPAANINIGNLQRIWKDITEDSQQLSLNVELPFEQWSGDEGYLKVGLFDDTLERSYSESSFSNPADFWTFEGGWEEFASEQFAQESHPLEASDIDVPYQGDQDITAWYTMLDLPLGSTLNLIGGARFETTRLVTSLQPEADAQWFPKGSFTPQFLIDYDPSEYNQDFEQDDILPALGLSFEPTEMVSFHASFSRTVARQTFKEITPILQQEYLGGPIFIGNPDLRMSSVESYDLRLDVRPYEGSLYSVSWFYKDVQDPIEYVQRVAALTFTEPVNYPEGSIAGFELEARQELGFWNEELDGLSIGANATFIDSEVTLPEDEAALLSDPDIAAPMATRDMTGAPEHLYNLFLTYELPSYDTQLGLFYTFEGDALQAGATTSNNNFVPSVYSLGYGTLNFSASKKLGKHFRLKFQAKNLTNPEIQEVYRSDYIAGDAIKTSYTKGAEFSLSLSASF
ncbi:MAG: TonB-dependent receptor [Planctomycetota bacterium]|nr:TonB-dependent receptor [Planctomycetota bacterium]